MANSDIAHVYVFSVKDLSGRRNRITANLLAILGIIIFLTRFFRELSYLNLLMAVLIFCLLLWNLFIARKRIPDFAILILIGLGLVFIPLFNLIGPLYLLLAFVSFRLAKPATINFSTEAITLHSLLKTVYLWPQVQHVILKDGLLTIDFKNNKILQLEVDEKDHVDSTVFNRFANGLLET